MPGNATGLIQEWPSLSMDDIEEWLERDDEESGHCKLPRRDAPWARITRIYVKKVTTIDANRDLC